MIFRETFNKFSWARFSDKCFEAATFDLQKIYNSSGSIAYHLCVCAIKQGKQYAHTTKRFTLKNIEKFSEKKNLIYKLQLLH